MAKYTVAQIMAQTGPFTVTADLGDGYKAPITLSGKAGSQPTLDVEDLVSAVLDGTQKLDKAGCVAVKAPNALITAKGVLTARTAKRKAARLPQHVAAALYASVGEDVPSDLFESAADKAAREAAEAEAQAKAERQLAAEKAQSAAEARAKAAAPNGDKAKAAAK